MMYAVARRLSRLSGSRSYTESLALLNSPRVPLARGMGPCTISHFLLTHFRPLGSPETGKPGGGEEV